MLESIVHSGFVYFMAAQRAVRRTLIKEFYGSLLVLLEHFCLYDLVLDFFTKIIISILWNTSQGNLWNK